MRSYEDRLKIVLAVANYIAADAAFDAASDRFAKASDEAKRAVPEGRFVIKHDFKTYLVTRVVTNVNDGVLEIEEVETC